MSDKYEALDGEVTRAREDPDPLSRQQINQAMMDIEDNHPLQDRAHLIHILPFCKPCLMMKQTKPNFKHALRMSLMQDMGMKVPKSEGQLIDDPFLVLGYGVNAYFDIMRELCLMFLTITAFFIPVYMWYKYNPQQALKSGAANPFTQLQSLTMGNMGGSQVICNQKKLSAQKLTFECPPGTDIDYKNIIYGIMSPALDLSYYCSEQAILSSKDNNDVQKCTQFMDLGFVHQQLVGCNKEFHANPEENTACSVDFAEVKDGPIKIWNNLVAGRNTTQCGDDAAFYLQSPCIVREHSLATIKEGEKKPFSNLLKRQIFGLLVGCIGVFVYLFIVIYIDYIKQVQKNKFLDFDVKTITAGDYSIEFDINQQVYDKWKSHYNMESNPMSEMAQFKIYIQTKLEERISAMDDLGYDGPWQGPGQKKIKIAQITFAFFNESIINQLKKRGLFIKSEKWDKLDEINDKIDDSLKDEALLNKLQTPCSVFATFETEEGLNRAISLNEQIKDKVLPESFGRLLNKDIEIQAASEPTDIIWENRHFLPRQRTTKRLIVYTIIVIMLAISGLIIYICSFNSTALKTKYPKTNCLQPAKDYGIAFGAVSQEEANKAKIYKTSALEKDAVLEFVQQHALQEKGLKTRYTDILQCFCKFQAKAGVDAGKEYKNDFFTKGTDDEIYDKPPICDYYKSDVANGKILSLMITVVIIAFNTILKKIIIGAITWVGEDTFSERLASITNGVFVAQFFNTGLLLLLVNANATEHSPQWLTSTLNGTHFDYSPDWYSQVGSKIVQTMFINALIIPFVGLGTTVGIPWVKRKLDGGNPRKTKKTSMAVYKALWSGGDYVIHFKYSGILNIAYITLMYGMGMPALFPIAALNYFNQYITERIIVAWYMKQPAALDDKLTTNCIDKLKTAPLIFLINGYWMLGNVQIFKNVWSYVPDSSKQMVSEHFPSFHVGWYTPTMTFALYAIALYVIQKVAADQLAKWGFAMADQELAVDEDLPNFFKSVKLSHADELISENNNMKENFGFEHNDPDTIEVLDATVVPKKAIQGTPWYQLLSNPLYEDGFNYIGAFVAEREKLIEDGYKDEYEDKKETIMTEQCKRLRWEQSDMVMILMNLAYIPDSVVHQINFKPGWQKEFKKNMEEFKKAFKQNTGKEWQFQNKKLEDDYLDFIHSQEATDPDVIKDKAMQNINEGFKSYFARVQQHKKSQTSKGNDYDFVEHSVN